MRRRHEQMTLFATIPLNHPLARREEVVALGELSRGEVHLALELATVLIMPSVAETVGLPMLEALSLGCPVLASDLPYAHDICGAAAWFFRPGDASACAAALNALLLDPEARRSMTERGHARSEHLTRQRPYHRLARLLLRGVEARCAR